jgi:hypothetical protein
VPAVVKTLRGRHEGEVTINPTPAPAQSGTGVTDIGETWRRVIEKAKGK